MDSLSESSWSGTSTELHEKLMGFNNNSFVNSFPRSPGTLTNQLQTLSPSLREVGILFEEPRTGKQRTKTLTKMDNYLSYRLHDSSDGSDINKTQNYIYEHDRPPFYPDDQYDLGDTIKDETFPNGSKPNSSIWDFEIGKTFPVEPQLSGEDD